MRDSRACATKGAPEQLAHLLAEDFALDHPVHRERNAVGLRVRAERSANPSEVDLRVRFFLLLRPLPRNHSKALETLAVFLSGVESEDSQKRIAACEAIGQLGLLDALECLQQVASQDADSWVRAAARRAIRVLQTPRLQPDDLVGVELALSAQHNHRWQMLRRELTNERGEAVFRAVPSGARYRLSTDVAEAAVSIPRRAVQATGALTSQVAPWVPQLPTGSASTPSAGDSIPLGFILPSLLAAAHAQGELRLSGSRSLERSYTLTKRLDDGELLCAVYPEGEQVFVEFRSDAPSMRGKSVRCEIRTPEEALLLRTVVRLSPDPSGVLTGRFTIGDEIRARGQCTLSFASHEGVGEPPPEEG